MKKTHGRGRPRTYRTPVMVKIKPGQLASLDKWISQARARPRLTRPEAIRRLMALAGVA
jgi:hypothetical protein